MNTTVNAFVELEDVDCENECTRNKTSDRDRYEKHRGGRRNEREQRRRRYRARARKIRNAAEATHSSKDDITPHGNGNFEEDIFEDFDLEEEEEFLKPSMQEIWEKVNKIFKIEATHCSKDDIAPHGNEDFEKEKREQCKDYSPIVGSDLFIPSIQEIWEEEEESNDRDSSELDDPFLGTNMYADILPPPPGATVNKSNDSNDENLTQDDVKIAQEEVPFVDNTEAINSGKKGTKKSKVIAERNEMARGAIQELKDKRDASKANVDEKLASLLKSVGSVGEYAEELEQTQQIDEWIGHIENMVILGYDLNKAKSFTDCFIAIVSFAKKYTRKKSIIYELFKIIDEVTTIHHEDEEEEEIDLGTWAKQTTCPQEEIEPNALSDWTGQDVVAKWNLFKTNTIFKKISYLITAAMSLTVCTTKKIEWSPFGLQLVSFEAAKEQLKAVDVIDALVKTFVWMCDVGWRCFETKSIAPILYSDARLQQYNEDCDYVLAKAESAIAGNVKDLGAFENKLNSVFKKTCAMKAVKNDGPTSLWLQNRYQNLVSIMEKLAAKRKNTDIRMQPIGFSLHGNTSVGKTTLGKLTMAQSLAAMNYCDSDGKVDDSRILTLDLADKYQSTYSSDILGIFMDDVGNAKSDFQKDNPHTALIIKFFNNVAAQAVKAELNAKGVVFIDFKVGIVTSNVKDLDARCYSNCPESVLRRFYHVDVAVKEKYRKQNSTMLNKSHPDLVKSNTLTQDVWELTIEEVVSHENGTKTSYEFVVLELDMGNGRTLRCEKLGLKDYLDVIIHLSKNHKVEQDSLIKKSKESERASFCSKCKRFPEYCECPKSETVSPETVEPHAVDVLADVLVEASKKAVGSYFNSWMRPVGLINYITGYYPIKKMATWRLAKELEREICQKTTPLLVAITPEWLFKTETFQNSVYAWQSAAAYYDIRWPMKILGSLSLGTLGLGCYKKHTGIAISGIVSLWITTCASFFAHRERMKRIQDAYIERRDALPVHAKRIRDGKFPKAVLFVATLALGAKLVSMWNDHRLNTNPQALTPEDVEAQPGWFGHMMKQIGWRAESNVTGALPEHIMKTGSKNLGWAQFTLPDGSQTACNIVYPQKGIVWFPRHIFYPNLDMTKKPYKYLDVRVYRAPIKDFNKNRSCCQFKFKAEWDVNTVTLDEIDMVATFVERCPDLKKSIIKFLPLSIPTGTSLSTIMMRDNKANLVHEVVTVDHGVYGHKYWTGHGGSYTTSKAATGCCMSMIITDGTQPVIAGFHIGGNPGSKIGIMMTVTQDMAKKLENKLLAKSEIRGLAASTELPKTQYGKQVLDSELVHPNALFIHKMKADAAIDVLGSTRLRSQMSSQVIPSILEKDARELFDIKTEWGPPKLKPNWKPFNATLEHIIDPSEMFLPSLVRRARQDWITPILVFARELNGKEPICPLNDKEMVLGVPGKRFLDALPMTTSMGYPVFGPKSRHFEEIRDENETLIDRIPSEQVKAEMARCLECWERGERAYPVTTATLKDEPTPKDKEKVRVFQAVAVALGLYIRKWFLPIARVLALNPILSESAVGVNAFSQQWDVLMSYAEKFAEDNRVIAWDYSKYDVRMNSQMTYAAMMCFIDIAEVCNYSEYDLRIMNAMVADIIHPLIDYNGTMIMAYNMNTSGNNITVNINSVANSLYVRTGFFHACPEVEDFRKVVAAMTYGDDFTGSVAKEYRNRFNFTVFRSFLAKHGMKITDPNKTENVQDDMNVEDADFLKRQSQYIPEIGYRIGKLTKNSMYKPLCNNLKSKNETRKTIAVQCIETYMHELFAHGRDEYNKDRPKIKELCDRVIGTVPPAVAYTFDERVEMWKEKYLM